MKDDKMFTNLNYDLNENSIMILTLIYNRLDLLPFKY